MQSTKIFRENPYKALNILLSILTPIFLIFIGLLISKEMPSYSATNGLNYTATMLITLIVVFAGTILVTFIILSFQMRKTLKCGFEGIELMESNFWRNTSLLTKIKWEEITDTNIVETETEVDDGVIAIYIFTVLAKNREIDLLELKTSTKGNIEGLINYVNSATPHLRYIWVKDKEINSRQAIYSKYGYTKIVR